VIDLLYVSFNRLEYTRQSFTALLEHTDWSLVRRLFVADDASTDGTATWLNDATLDVPVPVVSTWGKFGGPVAAMNWYLDQPEPTCAACRGAGRTPDDTHCFVCDGAGVERPVAAFGKVDNDFVVCPGWLDDLTDVLADYPSLDVLGTEPWFGNPEPRGADREAMFTDGSGDPVRHVGGKGLIRRSVFSQCRPVPHGRNGYQGWTQYQEAHPEVVKAWITPDLQCFGLDQIRESWDPRWRDLARQYEQDGWGRMWPAYGSDAHYDWWTPV
jgi:hypothetical protein